MARETTRDLGDTQSGTWEEHPGVAAPQIMFGAAVTCSVDKESFLKGDRLRVNP
jgi:hypothetical protein